MTEEEIKAAIEAAVTEATDKLKGKNTELLKEVRDLKAGKKTAEETAEDALADAERKSGDIQALERRLTDKHQREMTALTGERDAALGELKTMKIDNVITKTLAENNVTAFGMADLPFRFKAGATIENGEGVYEGKPLAEAIKAHLASDLGKHYVTAAHNTGTGATGSTVTNADRFSALSNNLATWSGEDHSAFAALKASNPAQYNGIIEAKGIDPAMKV